MHRLPVSICIPTFGREQVLLDTVTVFLAQEPPESEILVIDQTPNHEEATIRQLTEWERDGNIRWIQLKTP